MKYMSLAFSPLLLMIGSLVAHCDSQAHAQPDNSGKYEYVCPVKKSDRTKFKNQGKRSSICNICGCSDLLHNED
jgi:hypothetical protein